MAVSTIVQLYFSAFVHESRAFREARSVLGEGLAQEVVCIGYYEPDLPANEKIEPGLSVARLDVRAPAWLPRLIGRTLRWVSWTGRAARETAKNNPGLVHCHSLAALPAGLLAARRSKAPLLYDCHELESERSGWPWIQRFVARMIEGALIRMSDRVIVVGPLISEWYAKIYSIPPPDVVRNLPELPPVEARSGTDLRRAIGATAADLIFIYVGAIGHGRGIPALLEAFKGLGPQRRLVCMGYGELVGDVEAAARAHANIHYHPPVPSNQVIGTARTADVGLSLIEDLSLSYRYCLPNKLFECRHAGLPVIVSDLPEMAGFITQYGGGWVSPMDGQALRGLVAGLDRAEIQRVAKAARTPPSWAEEGARFATIVREMLPA